MVVPFLPEMGGKIMAVPGRTPNEKSVNRTPSRVESREFVDEPFTGPWPLELPESRTIITRDGQISVDLQPATFRWFEEVKRLPHAAAWDEAMWGFVVDTAVNVVDSANCGIASAMTEARQREAGEILKTAESRFKARMKYVPAKSVEAVPALVTDISSRGRRKLDDA
jgi:hypothetical protein